MFNKKILGAFATAAYIGVSALFPVVAQADSKTVKITAIVEHPALDAVRKGVKDVLDENGFKVGENLNWEFQSAQGDVGIAGQIAKKFVGENPDVIVAIATPSAQAAVASARGTIPVVFSAVTDPVAAKLVKSWKASGGSVTGVSDMLPLEQHLKLITDALPDAKTIGVPYNPGETNAVVLVENFKKIAEGKGIKVVTASAPSSGDVLMAVRSLVGKVDAIYVTTDNTIVSAFESVVKVGIDAQIPVFAGDTGSVERGAAAALGFNYYDIGRQTGQIVLDILKGKKAGEIDVQGVDKTNLHVNLKTAKQMGLTLDEQMVKKAEKIVE
jgi:putative ABC transport system substrate-binding protein